MRDRLGTAFKTKTLTRAQAFNQNPVDNTDASARMAGWVEIRTREVAKCGGLADESGSRRNRARANTLFPLQDRIARAQKTADKPCKIADFKGSLVGVLANDLANLWKDFFADVSATVRKVAPSDERSRAETTDKLELLHGIAEVVAKQLKKRRGRSRQASLGQMGGACVERRSRGSPQTLPRSVRQGQRRTGSLGK